MDLFVLSVFLIVYIGMILGEIPGLALDRSGIALLGAIAILAAGRLTLEEAVLAADAHTLTLLFGLMVISAQFRLGGFYTEIVRRIAAHTARTEVLLFWVIVAAGALSSVLANDIVCLAMTPMLVDVCVRRRIAPVPFLLALACASNIGSAATLIGNPQNMLIGETLRLPFAAYLLDGGPPALIGLAVTWLILRTQWRGRWDAPQGVAPTASVAAAPFDRLQTMKGLVLLVAVVAAFLFTSWPRDVVALTAAGVLLLSRRMASREIVGLVDWHLLVLFVALFVVNEAVERADLLHGVYAWLQTAGIDLRQPQWLFVVTPVLSNLVSNVPAVMLLLPASGPDAGAVLALASTLAGNLLIVGSIANIIVVEQARTQGVTIDWRMHAKSGVPVTLATLAIAAAWLWFR